MQIQFLGSGDAFGSGGRFNTCLLVTTPDDRFLLDCGASAMVAINRFGVDPNAISMILLTHLHGDHFGGVPFFVLDAQLPRRRSKPLVIAGPPGTKARIAQAMEVLFPGSAGMTLRFPLETVELEAEQPRRLGAAPVTPYLMEHPCGAPPYAYRIECAGKVVTFTGDTGWTDTLIRAARDADLLISECSAYDRPIPFHLDLPTLVAHREALHVRRLILTHLGPQMLAHLDALPCEYAEDGKVITV